MSDVIVPAMLIDEIKHGNCVLFVGAGLSRGSGLPGWDELVQPLANEINVPEGTDLLKAMQFYENKRGRRALISRILEATDTTHTVPSRNHHLLAQLPIDIWVTTNFDNLLERTLEAAQRRRRVVVYDQDLPYTSADHVTLIKMHGDQGRADSIVVTESDYATYFKKHNLVKTKLSNLIAEKTFLFIGYSINDPDFNQIYAEIAFELQEHGHRAYAILFDADDFVVDDLGRRNIEVLNIVTESVGDYDGRLGQVLQLLVDQVGRKPGIRQNNQQITSIFLSYDWEDRPEVRLLVKALRRQGIKIAWDQDWPHWQELDKELTRQIGIADMVMIYSTSHSRYSEWVAYEIQIAKQADKRIIILDRESNSRCDSIAHEDGLDISNATPERAAEAVIQILNPAIHQPEKPEPEGTVKQLLEAALRANLGIPTDTVTDKIFVSPDASRLVELAYEKAMSGRLSRRDPDRLQAALEYGRLRRFQGEWAEAERVLKLGRDFAVDNSRIYPLFCLELGAIEFERGGTISGIKLVREALGYIEMLGVTSSLVKALRQLGNMLVEQGEWEEATRRLSAAMYMAEYLKGDEDSASEPESRPIHYMLWIDCIREVASLLAENGKPDEALHQLQSALHATEREGISRACEHLRGIILYHLGRIYLFHRRDVRRALEYFDASVRILHKYDNPVRLAFLYDSLGRALTEQHPMGNSEDIRQYLEKAKRIFERCNHEYMAARVELSLGAFYRRQNQLDSAIGAYQRAQAIYNRLGKRRAFGVALLALGTSYAQAGVRDRAGEYLELAELQFREVNHQDRIRETRFELLKLGFQGDLKDEPLDRVLSMGKAENYDFHLSEVGEYRFHDWITKVSKHKVLDVSLLKSPRQTQGRIINPEDTALSKLLQVGIGDDAAVIEVPGSEIYDLILTTDAAPASICRSTEVKMARYAAKFSVVHTLSDVLAMGGTPIAILLQVGFRRDSTLEYAMTVIETVMEEANRYDAMLIGGDTKERPDQSIGCVGIGIIEKGKAVRRDGAKPGHIVAITLAGMPDGSGVRKIGCRWAQEVIEYLNLTESEPYRKFCRKNWKEDLLFLPKEIIAGARTGLIKSAIDTSDGVMGCLELLGRRSNVGFVLDETLIEDIIDERVKRIAEELRLRPTQFLFNAGHDWEIVLTVEEDDFQPLQRVFQEAGGDLARLGTVCPRTSELEDGVALVLGESGKKIWIPFFTDEKFVRRSYEERPLAWEDLTYFLEGARQLE
jgi:thiamin-phosphate kinase